MSRQRPVWGRLLPLALLGACTAPEIATFHQLETSFVEADAASERAVAVIDEAQDSLHIALPEGEDLSLAEAILRAWDRGLEVEVVTDIDQQEDPGIAALLAGGVPVTLADAGITYFDFNINADVSWPSQHTIMSHAYLVADREHVLAANRLGSMRPGTTVLLEWRGEELVEDLLTEHNQVFGGADATATTAFSGMAKSIADFRWLYHTQTDVDLELWFGPQERLTKRIIDATYSARSSVWLLTNDFTNEGLARALQEKARWGFDVKIVVGPDFGTHHSLLSRILTNETPDVEKRRVDDRHVPTIVLIDYDKARDKQHYTRRAYVLTHDLYAAERLHRGVEIITDQLIDGALWGLVDYDEEGPELEGFRAIFDDYFDRGGEL